MDNNKEELSKLVKQLEDLQIQQETIIKKIRASTEVPSTGDRSAASPPKSQGSASSEASFRVGERVLIKNRLGKISSIGRKASIKDRAGTVIRITNKRVHLKTGSGTETSRAPHNLTRLNEKEYEDIVKNA